MKIAFIVGEFPSLSQTFVLNQIIGLLDRGHDVDIYARRSGKENKIHEDVIKYNLRRRTYYQINIPKNKLSRFSQGMIFLLKFWSSNPRAIFNSLNFFKFGKNAVSLYLLFRVIPFLKKGPYDIVQCHFGPNGNLAILLKEVGIISGKIITAFHGYDITEYLEKNGKQIYKKLFKKGDLFLPISERWKDKLLHMGCEKEKIVIHRMGINLEKVKSVKSKIAKEKPVKILSIARLIEKKGIFYGIKAIEKIVDDYPTVEYLIIGDGPLKKELKDKIDELKLNQNIKMLGWMNQEHIFNILRNAHIFLAPSVTSESGDQEGIPVVLMEAMAHGLAVVSTFHSGIPEIIIDGENGFLVKERDADSLENKIKMLIKNPNLANQLGIKGREFIEKNHDINNLNDRLVEIYNNLLI
jgi:colanic acid/amylovoran biosynthesis glycosyltransferase